MKKKLKVMVHYTQYGKERSPNNQAELIRTNEYLSQKCDFIILDQDKLPREIGHLKSILELKKKIKAEKPDIVHIIGIKEGFHCTIAALLAGCKKRILITHGFAGYSTTCNALNRFFYRWIIEPITLFFSTHVQCNSEFSRNQQMIRLFADKKSHVIYNFLHECEFCKEHIWRKENKVADNDFIIATIGNMHSGKGYDIIADIVKHFSDRENIRFVIMGDGALKKSFDESLKEDIDSKKVFSLGKVPHDKAMQILSECNVFVLPTRFETLGMVFAEAGQCGLPSVGTRVGAVGEIVKDNETGYLAAVNDTKKMIEYIETLIENPTLCKKMGYSAKARVEDIFSSQSCAEKIFELYNL